MLSSTVADQIAELLPAPITAHGGESWSDVESCEERLAVTIWDQHRLWQGILRRISVSPFTSQAGHRNNIQQCEDQCEQLISRIKPETPQQDRLRYQNAIAQAPDDNLLYARFAQYLEATGSREEAIVAMQEVCTLLPDLEWPHYNLGDLMVRAGRYREAADCFKRALAIRRDFAQAQGELKRIQVRHPEVILFGR